MFSKEKKLPQKAILLLDIALSHTSEDYLEKYSIRVIILSENVTPLIQPMG